MSVTINGTTGIDAVQSGVVDLTTDVTGVLPIAQGGTGSSSFSAYSEEELKGLSA